MSYIFPRRDAPFSPVRRALLIVDVQKGFINEHTARLPTTVENLQCFYGYVAVAKYKNPEGSAARKKLQWHRFGEGADDCELAFSPKENAFIFEKCGYSSLIPVFQEWLYDNKITHVDICGSSTGVCVLTSAVDLFEQTEIVVNVLADACASTRGPEAHEAGLLAIGHSIGDEAVLRRKDFPAGIYPVRSSGNFGYSRLLSFMAPGLLGPVGP